MRNLEWIYGLPSNSPQQQAEADRGSLLATRSIQMLKGDQSQRYDGRCQKWPHWRTRRVVSLRRKGRCGHSRRPPTSWRSSNAVRLGSTRAPRDFQHQALLGKRRTSDAARYPNDLAMEYEAGHPGVQDHTQLGMMEAPGKGAQDGTHGLAEELDQVQGEAHGPRRRR